MNEDESHLNLLAIFHYILGALSFTGALVGLIYVGFGVFMMASPQFFEQAGAQGSPPPPEFIGLFAGGAFVVIGAVITLIVVVWGTLQIVAGRALQQRRLWTFCMVVAGLNCLHAPHGTVLGIFTFVVLSRPTVKAMFLGQPRQLGPYR